jgi:hypothetical protein
LIELIHNADKINSDREKAIDECFTLLRAVLERYQVSTSGCRWGKDCDAMIVGGVIRELRSMGYYPIPDAPYKDLCFENLSRDLCNMPVPTLCRHPDIRRYYDGNVCLNPKTFIQDSINNVGKTLVGLELENFKNKPASMSTRSSLHASVKN